MHLNGLGRIPWKIPCIEEHHCFMFYLHHNHQVVDNSLALFLDLPHLQF